MQHLTVIDYQAWAGRETELEAHDVAMRRDLGWVPEHKTFEWLASLRRMRDRRTSFGSLAPVPIFPLDPEDIADLMVGRMEMRTMLRGDLLERALADSGIKVVAMLACEAAPNPHSFAYLRAKKERMGHALSLREGESKVRTMDLHALRAPRTASDISDLINSDRNRRTADATS